MLKGNRKSWTNNRSRRLRKKLHVGEFKELGFTVRWHFDPKADINDIKAFVRQFQNEVLADNGLQFTGNGYHEWEGIVQLERPGICSDAHRTLVEEWLKTKGMSHVWTSALFDIWWDCPETAPI
ncbi:MAG: 50S ribosome-binding protein YggL [Shewanella sp.]